MQVRLQVLLEEGFRTRQAPLLSDAKKGEGAQEPPHYSIWNVAAASSCIACLLVGLLLLGCAASCSLPSTSAQSDEGMSAIAAESTPAHAKEQASNHIANMRDSMENFGNDLVDKLFDQALKVWPLHHTALDNKTLSQGGHLAIRTSRLSPPSTFSTSPSLTSRLRPSIPSGERFRPNPNTKTHGLSEPISFSLRSMPLANAWSTRSQIVAAAAVRSDGGGPIQLGKEKIPADVNVTIFSKVMCNWVAGISSSSQLPFLFPLTVKRIDNGFQIGFLVSKEEDGTFYSPAEIVATVETVESERVVNIRGYGAVKQLDDVKRIMSSMPSAIKQGIVFSKEIAEGRLKSSSVMFDYTDSADPSESILSTIGIFALFGAIGVIAQLVASRY